MKIIFLGTPQFAVPTLIALHASHHTVVAVVTQPQKPTGRGKVVLPSPVEVEAKKLGIAVYSFAKIRLDGVDTLKNIDADVMITCAYGQLLSAELLEMKKFGVINAHGSVLPAYRGSSPIQWSIINGETQTGITILKTAIGMDDGPIMKIFSTPILENETAEELFDRLSKAVPEVLLPVLDDLEQGKATFTPQDETKATSCKKLTDEMSKLNFELPAQSLVHFINGINMWPVATIDVQGQVLKIFKARLLPCEIAERFQLKPAENYQNGEIVLASPKAGLVIKSGDGFVELLLVQAPGAKKMDAKSFLNGNKILLGSVAV